MDLSNLSPDQQQAFFDLLSKANQQSIDPSSFGAASTQPTINAQPGDLMHPVDAINKIASMTTQSAPATPAAPAATPPQPSLGGTIATENGRMVLQRPNRAALGRLLGLKTFTEPVADPTNYYDTLAGALGPDGANKILPSNLPTDANGKPFLSGTAFSEITKGRALLPTANNPGIDKNTAVGLGVSQKQADKLYGTDATKTIPLTELRLAGVMTTAGASMTRAANQQLNTLLQYGGPGAAQQATQDAYSRLANLNRADGITSVIDNIQDGKADKRQRALLLTEVARAINPSGVISNEALNSLATDTAGQKINDWKEWLMNEATPTDFTGFLPSLKDLINQEKSVNQGLFAAGTQMGLGIIRGTNPTGAATAGAAIAANPIVNPKPQAQIKTASDYLKKFQH